LHWTWLAGVLLLYQRKHSRPAMRSLLIQRSCAVLGKDLRERAQHGVMHAMFHNRDVLNKRTVLHMLTMSTTSSKHNIIHLHCESKKQTFSIVQCPVNGAKLLLKRVNFYTARWHHITTTVLTADALHYPEITDRQDDSWQDIAEWAADALTVAVTSFITPTQQHTYFVTLRPSISLTSNMSAPLKLRPHGDI